MADAAVHTVERLQAGAGAYACGGYLGGLNTLQRTEICTALIFDRLSRKMRLVETLRREAEDNWNQTFYLLYFRTLGDRRNQEACLELARRVPGIASDYIVFCGVYFMAESAALLAREGQQVLLPDHSADCVMAQMTPARLLDRVLGRLTASGRKLVPLAYVNTSLAVKAVVGRYGGAVCTSANAEKMMNWAFRQGDGVLFLPDKNLARNTARKLGITGRDTHILDVRKTGEAVDLEAADKAALVLWPGLCAIHARFHPEQIEAVRKADPSCKVIVHPECSPEVVRAADGAGSTTYIIEYVRNAPDGAHIYVGTEINLVERLAREQEGRIRVEALRSSACSNMAKITPEKLRATLEGIVAGNTDPITVPSEDSAPAKASLERMLEACA